MQMVATGWLGSEEPGEARPVGFADFILQNRRPPGEGHTLEQVFARAAGPDRPPEPYDDDDRQAALLTRGYSPGLISQLSQQLGDVQAELQAEREKIAQGARRSASIRRAHEAGRLDAFAVMRAMDFDEGDEGRVRLLERRARNLRQQLADASEMMSPPQRRDLDPLEAATRRAHEAFAEVTRQRFAEAQAGRPGPRPFASASRGAAGRSTEHIPGGDCWVCAEGRRMDAARAAEADSLRPAADSLSEPYGGREIYR
jgi:hypothetical protein